MSIARRRSDSVMRHDVRHTSDVGFSLGFVEQSRDDQHKLSSSRFTTSDNSVLFVQQAEKQAAPRPPEAISREACASRLTAECP